MKLRRPFAALLGLGLLAAVLGVLVAAPSAQGRRTAPTALDRVAEWGVWKARAGHVTSLDELTAELPRFVHRGPAAQPVQGVVPVPDQPVIALKPVLYLYASRPTPVQVRVGLPVGGETLHYPAATTAGGGLLFSGRLPAVGASLARARPLPPVPSGHFWNDLRQVPASIFTNDAGESERFIFYDGLTDLTAPFTFYGAGEHGSVSARRGRVVQAGIPDVVYAVHRGMVRRVVVAPDSTSPTPIASAQEQPIRMLEGELQSQLRARGLTVAEAQSLLATWHHDLIEAPGDRRIYFLDRADYDRMLPLTITPRPSQLVRVGLVIELP